jgi:hypothetical protein
MNRPYSCAHAESCAIAEPIESHVVHRQEARLGIPKNPLPAISDPRRALIGSKCACGRATTKDDAPREVGGCGAAALGLKFCLCAFTVSSEG